MKKSNAENLNGFALDWAIACAFNMECKIRFDEFGNVYCIQTRPCSDEETTEFRDFYPRCKSDDLYREVFDMGSSLIALPGECGDLIWVVTIPSTQAMTRFMSSRHKDVIGRAFVHIKCPEGIEIPDELEYCVYDEGCELLG